MAYGVRIAGLLAGSILALSVGNVLLKVGMDRVAAATPHGAVGTIRAVAATWQVGAGVACMAAQFAGMLALFGLGLPVSVVVPVFGLNYVVTALLGKWVLGESVDATRWLGIAAVLLGVALIARSVGCSPARVP